MQSECQRDIAKRKLYGNVVCFVIASSIINYLDVGGNGETLLRVEQDGFHDPRAAQRDSPRTAILQFRHLLLTAKNQMSAWSYDFVRQIQFPFETSRDWRYLLTADKSLLLDHFSKLSINWFTSVPRDICTWPSGSAPWFTTRKHSLCVRASVWMGDK